MKYNLGSWLTGDTASAKPSVSPLATDSRQTRPLLGSCASTSVHFLRSAWPGAAGGLTLAVLFLPAYAVSSLRTGLGLFLDTVCGLLLGATALIVVMPIGMLGLALVRRIPLRLGALILTTFLCVVVAGKGFGYSPDLSLRLGAPPILLLMLAGAGLSVLRRRGPGPIGRAFAALGSLLLLIGVIGAAVLISWLAGPGDDPFLERTKPVVGGNVVPLEAPNPSQVGPYPVATLFYGSGTDGRRPEYGKNVALKTGTVDASPFLRLSPTWLGSQARTRYWGFESHHLPLNARVWFPRGTGLFPLVLIVHGNHRMEQSSDAGFAYLGELLASRGFIVASVDENFLNVSWSGSVGEEYGARSWLLLKHLELWRQWNQEEGNPFYHHVDMGNIALIGHSRGGEAIVHAARFNWLTRHPDNANVAFHFGFAIKTLIALAPTEGGYRPSGPTLPIEDLNYLVLQGSHDADVGEFGGVRRLRQMTFTGRDYRMKAALYIYRANHSQFNTDWGACDEDSPLRYLLNRNAPLDPQEQRTIAQVYISAFLEATLRDGQVYIPLFRDPRRAAHWLPDTLYLSRFQDSEFRTIADFDGPIEVTKTTLAGGAQRGERLGTWEQREMRTRLGRALGDHAIALGWDSACQPAGLPAQPPSYVITLPEISALRSWLQEGLTLSFCLADTGARRRPIAADSSARESRAGGRSVAAPGPVARAEDEDSIDMTLELVDSDGHTARLPLSHYSPLPRAIPVTFSKWPLWDRMRFRSPVEPVLETFEFPLADFAKVAPPFDPALLRQIRFLFDRTKSAVILLDQVGITRVRPTPHTPS